MAMGLATDRERQLALVMGVGIAIPIGNPNQPTQAAINIHAWLAYTVGDRTAPLLNDEGAFEREVKLNPWAFVFGPSITVAASASSCDYRSSSLSSSFATRSPDSAALPCSLEFFARVLAAEVQVSGRFAFGAGPHGLAGR